MIYEIVWFCEHSFIFCKQTSGRPFLAPTYIRLLPTIFLSVFPQKISLSNQDIILIVFKNVVTDLI